MEKKINIAICLSTEPRFWENSVNSITEFIKNCKDENIQIDIFYHFWNDITCQYPIKPAEIKLTDEPMIKNIDPATFQHHFKPTVGVCENKDNLNPYIKEAWEYIQRLKQEHNIQDNLIAKYILKTTLDELKDINMSIEEAFYAAIKRTSRIKFSQVISMCKSLIFMSKYADKNNIYYDIIIRSRPDICIKMNNFKRLKNLIRRDRLSRYIYFPELSVRTDDKKFPNLYTPHACFDFFITSSNIINKNIFKNYSEKIIELLFLIKKNRIEQRSVHNCVPLFLKQDKTDVVLGSKISPFSWSYKKQLKKI